MLTASHTAKHTHARDNFSDHYATLQPELERTEANTIITAAYCFHWQATTPARGRN